MHLFFWTEPTETCWLWQDLTFPQSESYEDMHSISRLCVSHIVEVGWVDTILELILRL